MNSQQAIVISKKLIDELYKLGVFEVLKYSCEDYDNPEEMNWNRWYRKNSNILDDKGISAAWGLTKVCFTYSYLEEYVVKINFKDSNKNFCEKEYKNFCYAKAEGFEEYFPTTEEITYKHVTYYLQERVDVSVEHNSDIVASYLKSENCCGDCANYGYCWCDSSTTPRSAYCDIGSLENSDEDIILAMTNDYKLYNFCKRHNINDLHTGNWGFKNGKPMIIDFSGFQ